LENLNELLITNQISQEPLVPMMLNFINCLLLLCFLSFFYKKYSRSLGGKTHIGSILPLVGLTVFLVIVVVKSSLALSLGLVGALSIVRFRTPIKEPEELGYLFLAIAIGLGLGAGFSLTTSLISLSIMAYLYFIRTNRSKDELAHGEYTIVLNIKTKYFNQGCKVIAENTVASKIIRVEHNNQDSTVFFNVSSGNNLDTAKIIKLLEDINKNSSIEVVETGVNW
jgi:hypothetical protein